MKQILIPLFLFSVLGVAAASGQTEPVVNLAAWEVRPTGEEIGKAMPKGAPNTGGEALLRCQITSEGKLSACNAIQDSPPGKGFSDAAMTLSQHYKVKLPSEYGLKPGDWVRVLVRLRPSVISTVQWARRPSGADMIAVFPPRAMRQAREGRAVLQCTVDGMGLLQDCAIATEEPKGFGFGDAAMQLRDKFQVALPKPYVFPDEISPDLTKAAGWPPSANQGAKVNVPVDFKIS